MIKQYKTVFISDSHLGMRRADTKSLLSFLKSFECETLILVGDIIDGWALKRKWRWPKINNKIVKEIIKKKINGMKIIYVPGNHDSFMRKFINDHNDIIITNEYVFTSIIGKKYLVIHGDKFDIVMNNAKWLALFGDILYDVTFYLSDIIKFIRWIMGKKEWSLAQWCKDSVKDVVSFIDKFEMLLTKYAKENECDGVICGHIHHAVIKNINEMDYINCGDWVESLTAIVENFDGKLNIIKWEKNEN